MFGLGRKKSGKSNIIGENETTVPDMSISRITKKDYQLDPGDDILALCKKLNAPIQEVLQNTEIKATFETFKEAGIDLALKLDEIFVLRYLVSEHGNIKAVITAIKRAIQWRTENKELISTLLLNPPGSKELFSVGAPGSKLRRQSDICNEHICASYMGLLQPYDMPILIVRVRYFRLTSMLKNAEVDLPFVTLWFILLGEVMFRLCDEQTRKNGKMSKRIEIVDTDSFSPIANKEFNISHSRGLSGSASLAEALFPQALGTKAIVNSNPFVLGMMKMLARIIPKRVMNRLGICLGGKTYLPNKDAEKCPFVKKMGFSSLLPDFLGGKLPCPIGLRPPLSQAHYDDNPDQNEIPKQMDDNMN